MNRPSLYLTNILRANEHAWAVRVCGSYFPDAHCGTTITDEFVASYAVSPAAWVAVCSPGGLHLEVEHTAGAAIAGAGGCNQYTVPKYEPLSAVKATDLVYVVDEAHDWGEAMIPLSQLKVGVAPLVPVQQISRHAEVFSVVLIGLCVFYTMLHVGWSLVPASMKRKRTYGWSDAKAARAVAVLGESE